MGIRVDFANHASARNAAGLLLAAALWTLAGCAAQPEAKRQAFVQERCTRCHGMPRASSFPTSEWPTVIHWMNDVLEDTGDLPYGSDTLAEITAYYSQRSPAALPPLPPDPARAMLGFESHELMRLYGAYSATAGDLDGDGDLDIVAGSFFTDLADPNRHSLVWLENDGRQQFTPHSLARIPRSLVALELADLDQDGRLDLVAGGLLMPGYLRSRAKVDTRAPLSLWSRR